MGKREFEKMLEQQETIINKSDDEKIRLKDWKEAVEGFYALVKPWLDSFEKRKLLTYKITKIPISEDFIEPYETSAMQIRFGHHIVDVRPVGMNVVGAKGRIDMEYEGRKVTFLLAEEIGFEAKGHEEGKLQWTTLLRETKGFGFEPLAEESFFDSLMEIVSV